MIGWAVRAIAALFTRKALLVAENLCLRQQLLVLRHNRDTQPAATLVSQSMFFKSINIAVTTATYVPPAAALVCDAG